MVTRVNGFSGMDIDSMVKDMMKAKRVPLDKLNQDKQILQWTREGYRELNSKLYDFRTNKLGTKYGVSTAMNAQKAVTSGNTDALTASARAEATGVDMTVSISTLATYTTLETQGIGSGKTGLVKLGDLDTTDQSGFTDEQKAEYAKKGYSLTINGVSFEDKDGNSLFTKDTTISSMISTINANPKANVVASFDEVAGKLIFRSKTSGAPVTGSDSTDGKIDIGTDPLKNKVLSFFNGVDKTTTGVDAAVTINGKNLTYKSNNITVNGIDLTLQKVTTGAGNVDNPVKITTQTDPQKALDSIKGFIEDYNSLISALNSKIDEQKYRDFKPLTDDQKKDMKDDDIKSWTDKAKSGLFKNDDIISSVLSGMRSILTEKLGPLSTMGITTGNYMENGKLVLDEDKLKKALADNPKGAMELFQGTASSPKDGIFRRMQDQITSAIEKMSDRAGTNRFSMDLSSAFKDESVMGRKMKDYNNRIATLITNLNNTEDRYYKQFTAMETAMSKLNSQASSLISSMK